MTAAIDRRSALELMVCTGSLAAVSRAAAADDLLETYRIDPLVHRQCLAVFRTGLYSRDFWTSIHGAEGLCLVGGGARIHRSFPVKLRNRVDVEQRCGLARALVRSGRGEYLSVLLEHLASESSSDRLAAAASLLELGEVGDGRALRSAMSPNSRPRLRLLAAGSLARWGNPDALSVIRKQLLSEDDTLVAVAGWLLGRVGGEQDIPRLKAATRRVASPESRAHCQIALALQGDEQGVLSLGQLLDSDDSSLQGFAATACGLANAKLLAPRLVVMMNEAKELDVRVRAAQSLVRMSSPTALEWRNRNASALFPSIQDGESYTTASLASLERTGVYAIAIGRTHDGEQLVKSSLVARDIVSFGHTQNEQRVIVAGEGETAVLSAGLCRVPRSSGLGSQLAVVGVTGSDPDRRRIWFRESVDDGLTFAPVVDVVPHAGAYHICNDSCRVLENGRIVVPFISAESGESRTAWKAGCFYSDDRGVTWVRGKDGVSFSGMASRGAALAELDDGRLLMVLEHKSGFSAVAHSTDKGDTWSQARRIQLPVRPAEVNVRRNPATGDVWMVCSTRADDETVGKDAEQVLLASGDGGVQWQVVSRQRIEGAERASHPSILFHAGNVITSWRLESRVGNRSGVQLMTQSLRELIHPT